MSMPTSIGRVAMRWFCQGFGTHPFLGQGVKGRDFGPPIIVSPTTIQRQSVNGLLV